MAALLRFGPRSRRRNRGPDVESSQAVDQRGLLTVKRRPARPAAARFWTLLVVRELMMGERHFNGILRGIPRMSRTMLSARLKRLESAGLVQRNDGEYQLTKAGENHAPVLRELGHWALGIGPPWTARRGPQSGGPDVGHAPTGRSPPSPRAPHHGRAAIPGRRYPLFPTGEATGGAIVRGGRRIRHRSARRCRP
ncbi:winged helix-turn-helix transcriptional regulator [Streptomyces iakyrus]|uniref:winged helix-turn-helix transcriptional regulator n=1 Tax=Streptomyces iakyrus TaxID=68219 RepID=UPI0033FFC6FB